MTRTKLTFSAFIAAAVLLTGTVSAYAVTRPNLVVDDSSAYASEDSVDFTVTDIDDEGCSVKTVLGKDSVTEDSDVNGEVTGALDAPKYAGKYKVTTTVKSGCGSQNGKTDYVTIQVGDKAKAIDIKAGNSAGFATKLTGTIAVDETGVDLLKKAIATVNGKAFTLRTKDDGSFKILLPSTTFTKAGKYRVTLALGASTLFFFHNESFVITVK